MRRQHVHEERRRRVLRDLNIASVLVVIGAAAMACFLPFPLLPWAVTLLAMLLVCVMAVICLTQGGLGQGLASLFVALVGLPVWTLVAGFVQDSRAEARAARAQLEVLRSPEWREQFARDAAPLHASDRTEQD